MVSRVSQTHAGREKQLKDTADNDNEEELISQSAIANF